MATFPGKEEKCGLRARKRAVQTSAAYPARPVLLFPLATGFSALTKLLAAILAEENIGTGAGEGGANRDAHFPSLLPQSGPGSKSSSGPLALGDRKCRRWPGCPLADPGGHLVTAAKKNFITFHKLHN